MTARFGLGIPLNCSNAYFLTKPMTQEFGKKLPTLGIHYKAIPDLEPTLPEGLLPDLPDPTLGIDTSLLYSTLLPATTTNTTVSLHAQ